MPLRQCSKAPKIRTRPQSVHESTGIVLVGEYKIRLQRTHVSLDFVGLWPTIVDVMPTKRLIDALFPTSRGSILAVLATAGDEGLHLREIARRANVNSKTAMRELHSLRDAGILVSHNVGRQVIYRLNPNCPIYDELRSIIRKTVGLYAVLQSALEPFADRIEQAYVYGSHARGDERSDSDIDLMVVGTVTLRELSSSLREAGRVLNRTINPTVYTPDEYKQELKMGDSFVSRVHTGKRLDLIGDSE